MATIKTKPDREKAKERIVDCKNSHNLAIVTGKGPNNFQPAASKRPRKCPRKRLIMPWPWPFLVILSTDLRKKSFVCTFPSSKNGHCLFRLYLLLQLSSDFRACDIKFFENSHKPANASTLNLRLIA